MNEQISKEDMIEALLLDYATGALSRPLEVMVETHIALNDNSARKLDMLMKLGGILLEECEPVSLSEDALDNVMAQIEAETNGNVVAMNNNIEAKKASSHNLPRPLADYVPELDCDKSWRKIGIGLSQHRMTFDGTEIEANIYRIAPGASVPVHSHEGTEFTLVLSGGFTDETGSYGPGDIAIQETGATHQPVADDDGECIVFAINEGAIKLANPIGRMISYLVN